MDDISTLQIGHGWHPDSSGSGLDRVFYSLMYHLPTVGVQAQGLVVGDKARQDAKTVGAASESDPIFRRLRKLRTRFADATNRNSFDLVASHFAFHSLPAIDRIANKPFVCHFHGPWALEAEAEGAGRVQRWVKMTLEQIVYRKADRFIVLSDAFRRTLVSEYGVPNSDIRTVPGGVEANRFDPPCPPAEARERLGWPLECPIVLSVRRLVRRVGLKTLVEAMQDVVRCVPNVRLLIAGDGPLADELQNQIDYLDLDDHVELLGFVPDDELPLAYRAADVSIVPTRALEGFGLVAVESLAAGTPVLVTPVGGLPEVVRDLSGDLIMESSSTQAISDHLTAALNGSLPLPTADTCRSFAASHYDWPVIARQVRSVYEEVL